MEQQYQYDVFISYRHKPLDSAVTQKTLHLLEGYRLPKPLRGKGHDIHRVFRDTEELSVSRILTETIDAAMRSTNCLILMCTTETPKSEWVDREIAMFIELGRAEKIFPLLISGTPETSFPPSLKRIPDIMDRVMDVRSKDNNVREIVRKEDTALLKLIACATGVDYDELYKYHQQRRLSRFTARTVGAAAALAGVTLVALGLMRAAQNYREQAQAAETASMQVLEELTYGLPDKLSSIPGTYSRISGILTENAEEINKILLLSTDQTTAGMEVAANYEKLATSMSVLGDFDGALEKQNEAVSLYETLCTETGNMAPLASAKNNYAKFLTLAGRYNEAAKVYSEAITLERELNDPVTLASMLANLGSNAVELDDQAAVESAFSECISLLDGQEETYTLLSIRSAARYNFGTYYLREGDYSSAKAQFLASATDYEAMCAEVASIDNRGRLLSAVSSLALSMTSLGEYDAAKGYYLDAIGLAEELAVDSENTVSASTLAELHNNCGVCLNYEADYEGAAEHYAAAAELYREVASKTSAPADVTNYAYACMNTGDNCLKMGDTSGAFTAFDAGLNAFSSIESVMSDAQRAEYWAWDAYVLLLRGNTDAALETALTGYSLQDDSVLTITILGYCCLYSGYYDDADTLLSTVAALGAGQAQSILLDLDSQIAYGLTSPHMEKLKKLISSYAGN